MAKNAHLGQPFGTMRMFFSLFFNGFKQKELEIFSLYTLYLAYVYLFLRNKKGYLYFCRDSL